MMKFTGGINHNERTLDTRQQGGANPLSTTNRSAQYAVARILREVESDGGLMTCVESQQAFAQIACLLRATWERERTAADAREVGA